MIDVVFLLLLFFMVSTSFIRESSLKVDLPEATGQALTEKQAPIDIIINAVTISIPWFGDEGCLGLLDTQFFGRIFEGLVCVDLGNRRVDAA